MDSRWKTTKKTQQEKNNWVTKRVTRDTTTATPTVTRKATVIAAPCAALRGLTVVLGIVTLGTTTATAGVASTKAPSRITKVALDEKKKRKGTHEVTKPPRENVPRRRTAAPTQTETPTRGIITTTTTTAGR